jgi:hypothetical protein
MKNLFKGMVVMLLVAFAANGVAGQSLVENFTTPPKACSPAENVEMGMAEEWSHSNSFPGAGICSMHRYSNDSPARFRISLRSGAEMR